jgi:hypothetical protein
MTKQLLLAFLISCDGGALMGSPASDLGSSSQEVRDAAASLLRPSYSMPSRSKWEWVEGAVTNGMSQNDVLKALSPLKAKPDEGGVNATYILSYRLDDAWIFTCWFSTKGGVLSKRTLLPNLRSVWVEPATNFTGVWVTYYSNGQTNYQIHYDSGKYHGEFISYYTNGSKCVVQHYDHHITEGADTGYFSSGRTNYHGVYKAGEQVGIWTWYNEDGSVKSTQDHTK